jgi:hypothetical protein
VAVGFGMGTAGFAIGWILHLIIWRIKRPQAYPVFLPIIFLAGLATALVSFAQVFGGLPLNEDLVATATACLEHALLTGGYLMGYAGIIEYSPSAEILYEISRHGPAGVVEGELHVTTLSDELLIDKRLGHLMATGFVRLDGVGNYSLSPAATRIVQFFIGYRRLMSEPPFGQG